MTKAYPIDNVDEVVERALAKLNISDDPENYLIAKVNGDRDGKSRSLLFFLVRHSS
jgi:hypothetical protein